MATDIMKTALSNNDIRLFTKNSEDKWASMQFRTVATGRKYDDNIFEITVWTNETADADKNITASLDVITFGMLLKNLDDAIRANVTPEQDFVCPIIEFEQTRWVKEGNRRKPDGTYVAAKLHMGKDKEGRVWIALTSTKQGRPNLKFIFHNNKTRNLVNRDGSKLSQAQISVFAAYSFRKIFSNMFYAILVKDYKEPEETNRSNGNSSNSNSSSNNNSDFDDLNF